MKPDNKPPESPSGSRLIDWLIQEFPRAKRQTLKRMVSGGRVTINGRPAMRLNREIAAGDVIRVAPVAAAASAHKPQRVPKDLEIVYEDVDIVVINKPAGLLTSTTPREPRPTLAAMLRQYLASREPPARLGVIHRLDRDAAGLLVFSKNDAAYRSLKQQFFKHTVDRIYLAVVEGTPPPRGKIVSRLVELPDGRVRTTRQAEDSDEKPRGQRAVTEYQVLRQEQGRALLRVTLHTGRKHQIRAHLSERGTPIVGDSVYLGAGKAKPQATGPLMLTAIHLAFDHPRTGNRMKFEIPMPRKMSQAIDND